MFCFVFVFVCILYFYLFKYRMCLPDSRFPVLYRLLVCCSDFFVVVHISAPPSCTFLFLFICISLLAALCLCLVYHTSYIVSSSVTDIAHIVLCKSTLRIIFADHTILFTLNRLIMYFVCVLSFQIACNNLQTSSL